MERSPLSSSESDDDLEVSGGWEERGFPFAAAERIYAGLSSQASAFNMDDLLACMQAACMMYGDDARALDLGDRDWKYVRLFLNDVMNRAFTRLMTDDYLSYVAPLPVHVLEAVRLLARLAVLLGGRCQRNINSVDEAVRNLHNSAMWPAWHTLGVVLDTLTAPNILATLTTAHEDATADMPAPAEWHTIVVSQLVQERGMQMCIQVLESSQLYPMYILDVVMSGLAKSCGALRDFDDLCHDLSQALDKFSEHLRHCITEDQERLADSGRDRTLCTFSHIIENLYATCKVVIQDEVAADGAAGELQRHFVTEMLKSVNFNKLLGAARECLNMLKRSSSLRVVDKGASLKNNALWLDHGNVVQQMLRANLHQRQYSDLVFHILQVLAGAELIRAEHLDMLWAATEHEGTHDEIKVNVYQMIESLAAGLSQPHLDLLFTKFQGRKGRSLTDTLRLMDLLRKLGKNDKEACMADRLLDLLWLVTTSADAPREVLQSNVVTETLLQYHCTQHYDVHLARCIEQLRSKQGIYTSLHLLYTLIRRANKNLKAELIGKLESKYQIHTLLVDSLCDFMHTAARWVAERGTPAGGQAPRPPGQGCYSYTEIMQEYVRCISHFALTSASYYDQVLALKLWDQLVAHPVHADDMNLGISLILAPGGSGVTEYLDHRTCEALLSTRIMALNSETLSKLSWDCFWQCFLTINLLHKPPRMAKQGSGYRVIHMAQLEGLSYLWQVVLTCVRAEVFEAAKMQLINLYQNAEEAESSAMFIEACTSRLTQAMAELRGPADRAEGAKRSAHRLLCLLTNKLENDQNSCSTMPPVLSHRSSFKGQRMVLDVNVQGPGTGKDKIKLSCHANEYVGMVRKRLADQLGSEPRQLRLICGGQEWSSDTSLLSQAVQMQSGRQTLIMAAFSPQGNAYSQAQPGFADDWRNTSTTSMLSNVDLVYGALFMLADLPGAPSVRHEAVKVLQLLPTRTIIPFALQQALAQEPGAAHVRLRALLLSAPGEALQPAKLLYTLQALHGLLFPILTSPEDNSSAGAAGEASASQQTQPRPSCGLSMASGCIPLLIEVLDQVQAHAAMLDALYLRELYSVVTHVLSNMVSSHLQLQAQAQADDDGTPPPTGANSSERAALAPIPEASAKVGSGELPAADAADAAAHSAAAASPSPEPADVVDSFSTPQDVLNQCEALALSTPVGGLPGPRIGDDMVDDPEQQATAAPPQQLTADMLATVVSLLIRLALHVGQLSQLPAPHSLTLSLDTFTDVQLVRECLTCCNSLLKRHGELCAVFLADARSAEMVQSTLLNSRLRHMREVAQELLKGICIKSAGGSGCTWLLRLLARLSREVRTPAHTTLPFFSLYKEAVISMPCDDPGARDLAESILQEEVSSLYNSRAQLTSRGNQALLEGKLRLVKELVRVLDKVCIGGSEGTEPQRWGLVQLLLRSYLYPEAATLAKGAGATFLDMEEALDRVCSEASCREAAMNLVVDLSTPSASNMDEVLSVLQEVHYRDGPITIAKVDTFALDNMRPPNQYMGLRNGGATCYMNAVLQQLFMQPRIRELVLGAQPVPLYEQADSMFYQLQSLFAHLCFSKVSSHHPRAFWQSFKDYDGVPVDIKEHQDAYEFFTRLQDCVDQHLGCTGQTPAMQFVMGGRFAQQIICKDVDYRSEREEDFYQISVDVKGKGSLEKSLEAYVAGELMEGDNAYLCEQVGRRVTALKRMCIKTLPQTLVIHLKRFEYDHLNSQRYKVRDRFEFPTTLDMFRYTADGLEALEGSTAQVAAMTDAQGGSKPRNYYIYELKGVVNHTGTAFAGHYYSFIKERPKVQHDGQVVDGKWFLFDDRVVREWSLEQIDEECYGGPSGGQLGDRPNSAYMLFYERKDSACFESAGIRMPLGAPHAASMAGQAAAAAAAAAAVAAATPAPAAAAPDPASASAPDDVAASAEQQPGPEPAPQPAPPPAAAAAPLALVETPYGMPVEVYESVLVASLQLIRKQHVDEREYGTFIRQLVDGREDAARHGHKRKRRKAHWLPSVPGYASASSVPGYASASSGNATPDRHRAATCSPAHSGPASFMAGTVGGGGSDPGGHPGTPAAAALLLSGSSQYDDALDVAAGQSMRLAMLFVSGVLLASTCTETTDIAAWYGVLEGLMRRGARPCIALVQAVLDFPGCLRFYMSTRWSEFALPVMADALTGALRTLAEIYPSTYSGGAGGGGNDAVVSQVISLQKDLFTLVHTIGGGAAAASGAPAPPPRAPFSTSQVDATRHVYAMMVQLLRVAPVGSHMAILQADVIPHALQSLVALLETQSVKNTNRYARDIVALFGFLSQVLQRLEPSLAPALLTNARNASTGGALTRNPFVGLPRAPSEPHLLLNQATVAQMAVVFENLGYMAWLLEDPALLGYDEVTSVLRAMLWDNALVSQAFVHAAMHLVHTGMLLEDDEGMWGTVMHELITLLRAVNDHLFEPRLRLFCGLPPMPGSRNAVPGLAIYLPCHDKPLLQLTAWWCISQLATHCDLIALFLQQWMQANWQATLEMFATARENTELQQDESMYHEGIADKYKDVAIYLACVFSAPALPNNAAE